MAKKSSITGNVDPLEVAQLRGPLLDAVMQSPAMRADLMDVAREIKSRYISKVPKDTGRLSQSVRIKAFQSNSRDKRWNVDVTIGGVLGVDYADTIEAEYHVLGTVLREMGFKVGDYVVGPRGRGAKQAPKKDTSLRASTVRSDAQQKMVDFVDRMQRPGRRIGSTAYDSDYETLQKMVQQIEDQEGPMAASIGRTALASYEAMREAKGLSARPFLPDSNSFRLVWFEAKGDKQVRRSKFFSTPEQAERWAETNLKDSGKVWPNAPRFDRYMDDEQRYERGMYKDRGANLYGVIMNNRQRDK